MPFWKQAAIPSGDGLRILLNMANYQDVLDAPAGVDWVDQDTTDGQSNDAPMHGGNGLSPLSIGMGAVAGGWDDVPAGAGGTNRAAEYLALTPVGPREYTLEMDFQVDGTSGEDAQLWLFQQSHDGAGQLIARVRYFTATGLFNLYMGFNADDANINISAGGTHNLVVNVYDDAGVMKADYILDSVTVATLDAAVALSEISDIRVTFPQLLVGSGTGLTFAYGGYSLQTTT